MGSGFSTRTVIFWAVCSRTVRAYCCC